MVSYLVRKELDKINLETLTPEKVQEITGDSLLTSVIT